MVFTYFLPSFHTVQKPDQLCQLIRRVAWGRQGLLASEPGGVWMFSLPEPASPGQLQSPCLGWRWREDVGWTAWGQGWWVLGTENEPHLDSVIAFCSWLLIGNCGGFFISGKNFRVGSKQAAWAESLGIQVLISALLSNFSWMGLISHDLYEGIGSVLMSMLLIHHWCAFIMSLCLARCPRTCLVGSLLKTDAAGNQARLPWTHQFSLDYQTSEPSHTSFIILVHFHNPVGSSYRYDLHFTDQKVQRGSVICSRLNSS